MYLFILSFLLISTQAHSINKIAAKDVTAILNQLATEDVNGGGEDEVVVDFQNMASHKNFEHDNAPSPLFSSVSSRISSSATMTAFEKLQTLYTKPEVTDADENTQERIDAANVFLDQVLATGVMKSAAAFLAKAGLSPSDATAFKKQLFDLWFTPFTRATLLGSSSFETVFIGETHSGDVVGLNYWYRFYLLEQANQVNYHGWFTREKGIQAEVQFAWRTNHALMDSFLLGTSPEFDMAAYTICALSKLGDCQYAKGRNNINLTVKTTVTANGVTVIDSVYPSQNGEIPVTDAPGPAPTHQTSGDFQKVVDAMRAADDDRPIDYKINWGNKRSGTQDTTETPLYASLNEDIFNRQQYKALIAMHNAKVFTPNVCVAEPAMNGFRKQYITNVFDAFTNTTVFQLAYDYLQRIGKADNWVSFRPKLWTLWMGTYSRCSSTLGSSGFEHVFSGEWKGSKVDGHHSWVRYYLQEKAGEINYHGYISYDAQLTGTFQYTWDKYLKSVGGFNVGTSPAFDFSLFTMCALTYSGPNCKFTIDGFQLGVTSYTQKCNEGICLSTAYPTD